MKFTAKIFPRWMIGTNLVCVLLCLNIIFIPVARVFLYPFGEAGPFFYNFVISFSEILFISMMVIERRRKNYPVNHLPAALWPAFVIWALVAILNFSNMPSQTEGMAVTGLFFIHFFFFVSLTSYLSCRPEDGRKLIYAIVISALVFMPFFWLKLWMTYGQIGFDWAWSLPGFENVRHFGYLLGNIVVVLGLLPLMRIYKNNFKASIFIVSPLLLAFWVMLFWSGGRGMSIAAISSIGFILLLFRPDGWRLLIIFNLCAIVFAALLSLLLPSPNGSYGLLRFMNKFDGSLENFSAGRTVLWAEAINIWAQNIWFGIGAGQTRTVIATAHGIFGQLHNVFLQAMMAWGIVGGVPFLMGVFGIFWIKGRDLYHSAGSNNTIALIAYGMALSTAIDALVDGSLYYPYPLFLFVIAISVAGINSEKPAA